MIKHLILSKKPTNKYRVGILIKESAMVLKDIQEHYLDPLLSMGIPSEDIIAFNLIHNEKGKATAGLIREHLKNLEPAIQSLGIKHLLVTDAAYFKIIAKVKKTDTQFGYVLDSIWDGVKVILGINHQQLFYTPEIQQRLDMGLKALALSFNNKGAMFKGSVIHGGHYFADLDLFGEAFETLHQYDALTCDIESPLDIEEPIHTIGFAWDQHNGCVFDVREMHAGGRVIACVRDFFLKYRGKLIYHNCTFDTKKLIRHLFMTDSQDIEGMLEGLHVMHRDIEDTKILAYLATNTTAGNHLGLKYLAFEFTGNYALEEMNDISKYPIETLMEYNLIDCLATWFVYDKYREIVRNEQEEVYTQLFMPAQKVLTQTELVGMPMDMYQVKETDTNLSKIRNDLLQKLSGNKFIQDFENIWREHEAVKATAKLKKKIKTAADYADLNFNPNSDPQLRSLLFDYFGFPVQGKTDSGLPSTDGKTLNKLIQKLKRDFNIGEHEI